MSEPTFNLALREQGSGWSKNNLTLPKRLEFLRKRRRLFPFMVDCDHAERGGPRPDHPHVIDAYFLFKYVCVPFLEFGKAVWLFQTEADARRFAKEYGGIYRPDEASA